MSDLRKVIVVDNGARRPDFALSAELAGMGYASITISLDATEEVLALLESPAAVVLQISPTASFAERRRFLALAEKLRLSLSANRVPVILTSADPTRAASAALLRSELGAHIVSEPDL